MTRYWIKIVLGALLIFAAGMAIWKGVHMGVNTVHVVTDTADPITIPLKIVNFRVDGTSLGRLEKIRLIRTAPKEIASVEVTVRLDSAAVADRLRECTLRIDDVENMNDQTSFVCVAPGSPAAAGEFEPFGEVRIEGTEIVLPLLLPAAAVRDLQHGGSQGADSMAAPVVPPVPDVPPAPGGAEAAAGAGATSP
jgi:hypothetical protein